MNLLSIVTNEIPKKSSTVDLQKGQYSFKNLLRRRMIKGLFRFTQILLVRGMNSEKKDGLCISVQFLEKIQ